MSVCACICLLLLLVSRRRRCLGPNSETENSEEPGVNEPRLGPVSERDMVHGLFYRAFPIEN